MTEAQKMGQVLFLTIDPIQYFINSDYKSYVQGIVKSCSPGGLYFFSNLESYDEKITTEFDSVKLLGIIRQIKSFAAYPPLTAADFETGAWYWDLKATRFPCPQAIGAVDTSALVYRQGKIIGNEAKAQGINMVFAPVITISSPQKTILENMNCYGSDPLRVADFSARFVQGIQDAGVTSCLRFFDPENNGPDEPVRSGISAKVIAIMGKPHSLVSDSSSVQTKKTLSAQYSFNGIVINSMAGLDSTIGLPRSTAAFLDSFKEGQDMAIIPDDMANNRAFVDYLLNQIRINNYDASFLDASVKKILLLKENLGLQNAPKNDLLILSGIGVREFRQTAEDLIRSSVTVLKNEGNIIPLKNPERFTMFVNLIDRFSSADGVYFSEIIHKDYPNAKIMSVLPDPDPQIIEEILRRAGEADAVICTLFMKPVPEAPSPKIPAEHLALLRRIAGNHRQTICISFYSPTYINDIPAVKAFISTYSLSTVGMQAAMDVVFGKAGASGKLPLTISRFYPSGFGITLPGPGTRTAASTETGPALK
jgi:beta-N-acetylhexosaminidase